MGGVETKADTGAVLRAVTDRTQAALYAARLGLSR